jgi:hypothetical protein
MSDYLDRLIEGSRGRVTTIRPRPTARFEAARADLGSGPPDVLTEIEAVPEPPAVSEPAAVSDRPAGPRTASSMPMDLADATSEPPPGQVSIAAFDARADRTEPARLDQDITLPPPAPDRSRVEAPVTAQPEPAGQQRSLVMPFDTLTDDRPGTPVRPRLPAASLESATLPSDRPVGPAPASAESRPRAGVRPAESFDVGEAARLSPWSEPIPASDPWPAAGPSTRVTVTIGRIEVRAPAPPPAPARPRPVPPQRGPALPLDEYLKRRNGSSR